MMRKYFICQDPAPFPGKDIIGTIIKVIINKKKRG